MMFVEEFVVLLKFYPALVAFVSGFLTEEVLLFLGFLSGQGIIGFEYIVIFGLLGTFLMHTVFYLLGRSNLINKWFAKKMSKSRYSGLAKKIAKVTHNNVFLSLFLSKFVYGARTVVIVYLSHKKMPYLKFIKYEIPAMLLWALIMLPLSWMAGIGILSSFSVVNRIEKTIGLAVVLILLMYYLGGLVLDKLSKIK